MIGKLISYAFGRAASRTVDSLERRLIWSAIGGFMMSAGAVFGLILAYIFLESEFGARTAVASLAGGCIVVGAIGFWMPTLLEWLRRPTRTSTASSTEIAEAVDEEAHAAVDTLGPIQVIASAFMMGLSAGRSMSGTHETKAS